MPEVVILVLNWNNAPDTISCLASLVELEYPHYQVVVVDNGSQDDSVAQIKGHYPMLPILELDENLGYAGGNNRGMEYALDRDCDYVWLLNNDVTVASDALSALMAVAMDEPRAGFLGPKVYMREAPQRILSAGGEFSAGWQPQHRGMGKPDTGQYNQVVDVDFLSGCALLVSRSLVEQIGSLDDDFFAYYEDIEWCYRGSRAGYRALFVPEAAVWHPETLRRDAESALVKYYASRNRLLFLTKHRLGVGAIARALATYLIWVLNWSVNPKWRHKRPQRDALLWAIADFWRGRFGKARSFA